MVKNLMDEYVQSMRKVGNDKASYKHIEQAVERERLRGNSSSARTCRPKRTLHYVAAAACAGILIIGGASILPHMFNGGNAASNPDTSGFVLSAYAEGNPVSDTKDIVSTNKLIQGAASWSEGDDRNFEVEYSINPDLVGNEVASIEYKSTNKNVLLEGLRDRRAVRPGEINGTPILSSFIVGGPNATLPDLHQLDLRITVFRNDAINTADEKINSGGNEEAWDLLSLEIERAAAEELASGTLEITATFTDGSTLTHVYRILPVDDFEQVWLRNNKAFKDFLKDENAGYTPEQLYNLEQVK